MSKNFKTDEKSFANARPKDEAAARGIRVLDLSSNHGSTARESVFVSFALFSMGQLYPSLKRRAFCIYIKKEEMIFIISFIFTLLYLLEQDLE